MEEVFCSGVVISGVMRGMDREREGGRGMDLLVISHALPLFQIRPGAETFVDFARQDQYPRFRAGDCGPFSSFPALGFGFGFGLHGVDLGGEVGEELAGDGVAVVGAVEAEDADVAEVGGGDVVGFYEGGGGGVRADVAVGGEFGRGVGCEECLVVVENEGGMSWWTHVWERRGG